MIARCSLLWLVLCFPCLTQVAVGITLFDGSLGATPAEQGWAYFTNPLLGAESSQEVVDGALRLDTLQDVSEQAGFFSKIPLLFQHPAVPTMDFDVSPVTISFTLRQLEGIDLADNDPEASEQRNRGGFALIAIGSNLDGIELQFQRDRIVSLDDGSTAFPVGESATFDTSQWTTFDLLLDPTGYRVTAGDDVLLAGRLRDYSDIAPSPPFGFPYQTPDFLFFGDNTGRAGAITELRSFEVSIFGDCNDDGVFADSDLSCLRSTTERDVVLSSLELPLGDLNLDGAVNFADFLVLSANFSQTNKNYRDGNLDLDPTGEVAFIDFLLFSANFGVSSAASETAARNVPEPSAPVSCLGALLLLLCHCLREEPWMPTGNRWKTNR